MGKGATRRLNFVYFKRNSLMCLLKAEDAMRYTQKEAPLVTKVVRMTMNKTRNSYNDCITGFTTYTVAKR
jgi:hypothetical protein